LVVPDEVHTRSPMEYGARAPQVWLQCCLKSRHVIRAQHNILSIEPSVIESSCGCASLDFERLPPQNYWEPTLTPKQPTLARLVSIPTSSRRVTVLLHTSRATNYILHSGPYPSNLAPPTLHPSAYRSTRIFSSKHRDSFPVR